MTNTPLSLNPDLDSKFLRQHYSLKNRAQIREILTDSSAEAVLYMLERQTPWGLAFNRGDQVIQLDAVRANALKQTEQQQILSDIHEGARSGYQFFYNYYPLFAEYFGNGPRVPLFDFYEYLNSPDVLETLRTITGIQAIRWADAQATLFRSGHFLKYHTDETPSQQRLVAYVFNFTKGWGRDWGGYLQFFDAGYDVEQAYRPVFNALNMFTIPADHSVSMVASYAPGHRFSITGWLRGDAPPGPIAGRVL